MWGLALPHTLRAPTAHFLAVDMLMRPSAGAQLSREDLTPEDLGPALLSCSIEGWGGGMVRVAGMADMA